MSEFDWIARYFEPLTMGREEALGLADDGALLSPPNGQSIVVTSDTLNEGVHFLPGQTPENIAHKALRVNLSDLAAMGASPYAYQLNLALPKDTDERWVKSFTAALLADQERYGIFCSGGDTTTTNGPLSISITAFGLVPEGKAIKRSGARDGDFLMVTGTIGDAYIALQVAIGKLTTEEHAVPLGAMMKPEPRVAALDALRLYAHAAADVSDGLIADAGHIVKASGIGAEVSAQRVPYSAFAQDLILKGSVTPESLMSGGDDYELVLAVPPQNEAAITKAFAALDLPLTTIGHFTNAHKELRILDESGELMVLKKTGWSHF